MPKQVIDVSGAASQPRSRFLSYGPSRTGKTAFAATFPRPLFLSDQSEGGWETIRHLDRARFYEPDKVPEVWAIPDAQSMFESLAEIRAMLAADPTRYGTVVIDSLSFYADSYFAQLQASVGKTTDSWKLYQNLADHIRVLMIQFHTLPVHVVWICLESPAGEGEQTGGISLPGQSARKAPARCDFWFYHRTFTERVGAAPIYEVRTRRFGQFPCGGRDGGILPDPITNPSYRDIEEGLGWPKLVVPEPNRPRAATRRVVGIPGNGARATE